MLPTSSGQSNNAHESICDGPRNLRKLNMTRGPNQGQKVLVLLPDITSKFLTCWQSPFEIIRRVGPMDYEVFRPSYKKEKQIYHINLLKVWREQEGLLIDPAPEEGYLG